ncbi:MAG: lysylphosphatidylglycerol synthase transmembrane domain-containing protein [Pseudomonadota bacterium]
MQKSLNLGKNKIRLILGYLIGILFIYLAVRKVDFAQMGMALKRVNFYTLLPAIPVLFLSHYLRALRWRYLLDPIRHLDIYPLFSSLIIGYTANLFMPAHLGEILRAYILSKKRGISGSAIFATIVVERIIDVLTLLALMLVAIMVYPFPRWLKTSGYIMFAGTLLLLAFLILLKKFSLKIRPVLRIALRPLPQHLQEKSWDLLERFTSGISLLKQARDYPVVAILSLVIWACYGLIFYLTLHAFDFVRPFQLPWSASLILLVITTIGVVIPSSPGYVGTYHYLCQVSLTMFGVLPGPALSFAAVVHGINFLPVLMAGLILSYFEGFKIFKIKDPSAQDPDTI